MRQFNNQLPGLDKVKVNMKEQEELLQYVDPIEDFDLKSSSFKFRILFDNTRFMFRLFAKKPTDFDIIVNEFKYVDMSAFFTSRYGRRNMSDQYKFSVSQFGYFPVGLLTSVLNVISTNIYINPFQEKMKDIVYMGPGMQKFIKDFLYPLAGTISEKGFNKDDFFIDNITFDSSTAKNELGIRDYQCDAILAAIFKGKGRGLIESPTGSGKSLIIASIIYNLQLKFNKDFRFLIYVPNIQLVAQFYSDLVEYGFDPNDIAMCSGSVKKKDWKDPLNCHVVIANHAWCNNHLAEVGKIDVLLIDEVHRVQVGSVNFSHIESLTSTKIRFGFSGTMPKKGYVRDQLIGLVGPIIFNTSVTSLQDDGFLSQLKITKFKIHDNIVDNNADYLFNEHSNYKLNDVDETGYNIIGVGDAYRSELEWLEKECVRLFKPIWNYVIDPTQGDISHQNAIILFDRLALGKAIYDWLLGEVQYDEASKGRKILYIDGSTSVEEREKIRAELEKSNDNILIGQSSILSTGWNCKNLSRIIFMCGGKAMAKTIQAIGRTLRLHAGKEFAEVIDVEYAFKYSKQHARERRQLYQQFYNKSKYDSIIETTVGEEIN